MIQHTWGRRLRIEAHGKAGHLADGERLKCGERLDFSTLYGGESSYAESGGSTHMTKADLVEKVTALGDLTRRDGEVIVETIFGSVIGALQSGDKIEIRGFGSFRIRQRNPRIGRNPKTGERVDVPAKRVPYFKPSKELRDLVNPDEASSAA
jgi:integration host factor subunit beta